MEPKSEFAKLCKRLGISVAEASRRLDVPYVTAYRWHAGTHQPSRMARHKLDKLRRDAKRSAND
jgi:transposase